MLKKLIYILLACTIWTLEPNGMKKIHCVHVKTIILDSSDHQSDCSEFSCYMYLQVFIFLGQSSILRFFEILLDLVLPLGIHGDFWGH